MLKTVEDIARRAGGVILDIYQSLDFGVQTKADDSPLTKADLAANDVIVDQLRKNSDYPVLSEEAEIPWEERSSWNKFWIVDPLDGTKDFIAKIGGFTVNIALIEDNAPVLGVVYAPVEELLYSAELSKGASCNGNKIFNDSTRSDLVAANSQFHSSSATEQFLKKYNIKNVRKLGSSLKICKLAEGEIDVYPRLNGTMEWDTAAAHIIAKEAGCKLIDVTTGSELVYNKANLVNNHFIASRNDLSFV